MTELGNRLKEAREAKGLSLDELQTITKIQKRYLLGIEEGNYAMMPGKFYVRAFIKQYAEAVGLEPEEIFDEYKNEIPSTYSEDLPNQLSRVQSRKSISANSSKVLDILPKLLISAFVIGAVALLWYFLQKNVGDQTKNQVKNDTQQVNVEESDNVEKQNEKQKKDQKTKDEEKQEKDGQTAAPGTEKDTENAKPAQAVSVIEANRGKTVYELKNADKFELKVVSTGQTWVNILNGKGYSFFKGMLTADGANSQTFDFSKESEAIIVIGNTINTEMYVNGQKVEFAVPPAEIVRQEITIRYVPTNQ